MTHFVSTVLSAAYYHESQRRNSAGAPASGWLSDESDSEGEVLRSH